MKIVLFGGTFNPIHIGHLAVADNVLHQFGYDRLYFIPVCKPVHKALAKGATDEDRLCMIEKSIQGQDNFFIEDCELRRGGKSYTYKTLQYITQKYEDILTEKPGYIIGSDWLSSFSSWSKPDLVASSCNLIIAKRPQDAPSATFYEELEKFEYPHRVLDCEPLAISSSVIRKNIAQGGAWRYLVVPQVYEYIREKGLYAEK